MILLGCFIWRRLGRCHSWAASAYLCLFVVPFCWFCRGWPWGGGRNICFVRGTLVIAVIEYYRLTILKSFDQNYIKQRWVRVPAQSTQIWMFKWPIFTQTSISKIILSPTSISWFLLNFSIRWYKWWVTSLLFKREASQRWIPWPICLLFQPRCHLLNGIGTSSERGQDR